MTDSIREAFIERLRENPLDRENRLVFADWLDENAQEGDGLKIDALRNGWIPLWPLDIDAATLLARCHFTPGSWDKKFANGFLSGPMTISSTVRQFLWLWILTRRYRRQIGRMTNPVIVRSQATAVLVQAESVYVRYYELHKQELIFLESKLKGSGEPAPGGSNTYTTRKERERLARRAKELRQLDMPLFD
jgi:uncharacterized protein (TIGR02996 family)